MRRLFMGLLSLGLLASAPARGDDPVFSGPQAGEKLTPFTMTGVFEQSAGKKIDLVSTAGGKPILLVFVHEANRPSIAVSRALLNYGAGRAKDGLVSGLVWLADDATAADQFLKRARRALPKKVPIGISVDGKEGPGAYGLNRNVTLTILVGKDGRVTANFALVQPSLQADVPRVLAEVVKLIGGKVPPVDQLAAPGEAAGRMPDTRPSEDDPELTERLRAVIRSDASAEQVARAGEAVETYVAAHPRAKEQLGQIARRVVDSGKLESYGTPPAQKLLVTWAERFGPKPDEKKEKGAEPK
ncbi:MAG: hypothetical protein LC745_00310 [Planctomycetia bacterium]|nr:hypothetical protein [Planctomycetia bacterium]